MNQTEFLEDKSAERTDPLWPHILNLEFLTSSAGLSTQLQDLARIPASSMTLRRSALIDLYKLIEWPGHNCDQTEEYLNELVDSRKRLTSEDASLILSTFEVLWSDGCFEKEVGKEWLEKLVCLAERDSHLGNPLKLLAWRMRSQSDILLGFPRWQIDSSIKELLSKKELVFDLPPGLKKLEEGWKNWFGLQVQKDPGFTTTYESFIDAIRGLGLSNSYYYGAIEGASLVSHISFGKSRVSYWDVQIARKQNDIALIVSNALSNLDYSPADPKRTKRNDELLQLCRHQMLVERLALRYWQIDGFVRSISGFCRNFQNVIKQHLDANKLAPTSGETNSKSEKDQHLFPLRVLAYVLRTAPWGWPYEHASTKSLKRTWEEMEGAIVHHYEAKDVADAVDSLIEPLSILPEAILYRCAYIPVFSDLMCDRHVPGLQRYSSVVLGENTLFNNPTEELFRMWKQIAGAADDSGISMRAAVQFASDGVREFRYSEQLISTVFQSCDANMANSLLGNLRQMLCLEFEKETHKSDAYSSIARAVMNGLNNRQSMEGVDLDQVEQIKDTLIGGLPSESIAKKYEYGLKLLGGRTPTEEEDRDYLDDIISHLARTIDEAARENRHRWSLGHKQFPFTRPISKVATQGQQEKVVSQIQRALTLEHATQEEIEGIFASVGQFLRGVRIDDYDRILNVCSEFASTRRPCADHSQIFNQLEPRIIDSSLKSLGAIEDIISNLNVEQLEMLGEIVHTRPKQLIFVNIETCSLLLAHVAIYVQKHEIRFWARDLILESLFMWNTLQDYELHSLLGATLSSISGDGDPLQRDEIIAILCSWFLGVSPELKPVHVNLFAYHVGRLLCLFPGNRSLNEASQFLTSHPRSSVRKSFSRGKVAGEIRVT